MELINATALAADYTTAMQPSGRELLVTVVKGTFRIPASAEAPPELAGEQVPPTKNDVFAGDPGLSAPRYEVDFAARKPRCDVLLNGSAYAPRGEPADRVTVGLSIGTLRKSFAVVGPRVWKSGLFGARASKTAPFVVLPISYDVAFGGIDSSENDPVRHFWYPTNHAGVGYHEFTAAERIDGQPLPNTEELDRPVTRPKGNYRPMAFGPIARAWQPRSQLAGTYDQRWLEERAPFLPDDFDDRYYQSAPFDQQIAYPEGGEIVEMLNLTPGGRTSFRLPAIYVPVSFRRRDASIEVLRANLDTIVIEPDAERFMLTWRATMPLGRNIHEIAHVVIGRSLHDAESPIRPKPRFASLAEVSLWHRRLGKPAA